MTIPESFKKDIDRALAVLRQAGSTEVYLFGSIAEGNIAGSSDIDLAVRGIPASRFFKVYSEAARNLEHELDLVDLDHETDFANFLQENDRFVRIN